MASTSVDVDEELAEAPVGRLHRQIAAVLAAVMVFDGYDVFNPAYVIHYVMQPWHLKHGQAGLLVSSGLVGFLVGSALHGLIADRVGRRLTLLGGLWVASVFSLATALFGHSFASFCTLRLLTGLGLGVLLPLATTYINEFAPRRSANTYAIWAIAFGWAMGGSLAGIVGVLATPRYGWQSLYLIGCVSFMLIPVLHVLLPESPRYLALHGRTDELRSLLSRLRPEHAQQYDAPLLTVSPARCAYPMRTLLAARYRRTTLCIWISAFFGLFCIYGLSGWVPTVLQQRGESFVASFSFGALLQIATFVGGLACGLRSDRHASRRSSIVLWWVLGAATICALALIDVHVMNGALVVIGGFFFGAQFVLNNFTANAYDTNVRATAVGMELGVGRIGAILGPWIAGVLQELYVGPTAMFATIAGGALVAAIAVLLAGNADKMMENP